MPCCKSWILAVALLVLAACSSQPPLPKLSGQAVILAFGDSLTYGTGAGKQQDYPAILSKLSGFEVVNAGVPGEVTSRGLRRLPQVLAEVQPELMILCHGGNDLIRKSGEQQAADNIRQMIQLAKQQGIAVILIAVPKPGVMLSEPEFYEQLAEENHIPLLSGLFAEILRKPSLKSDMIHPNGKGYAIMAEAVFEMMSEVGSI